jgi:hypothetical protein
VCVLKIVPSTEVENTVFLKYYHKGSVTPNQAEPILLSSSQLNVAAALVLIKEEN